MNTKVFHGLTNFHILWILCLTILVFQGVNISLNNFNNQIASQYREATNTSATAAYENSFQTKALIKQINASDAADDRQTKILLAGINSKADRNLINLINSTNQTNTLLRFLVDNFGPNSGYLEKENFQYRQANQTFAFLKQAIHNQEIGLKQQDTIINNQHQIINNQIKILNQTK